MFMFRKFSISWAATPGLLLLATTAWGAECKNDTDCESGQACQKATSVDGCSPDAAECDSTPREAEVGTCVTLPVPCERDGDCAEYLSCVSSSVGTCSSGPNGETTCDEPESETKFCGFAPTVCEVDDDCPREFTCVESTSGCDRPEPAEEGAMPEPAACEATTTKYCAPKEIECETDEACPTDWRCVGTSVTSCSGSGMGGASSGGTPGGGVEPTPIPPDMGGVDEPDAPPTDAVPPSEPGADKESDEMPPDEPTSDEPTCETIQVVGHCLPNSVAEGIGRGEDAPVYDGGLESDGDKGAPTGGVDQGNGAPGGEPESADPRVSGGGCSSTPAAPARAAWALLGLFLLAPLARGRARAEPPVGS